MLGELMTFLRIVQGEIASRVRPATNFRRCASPWRRVARRQIAMEVTPEKMNTDTSDMGTEPQRAVAWTPPDTDRID
jgi:hypothetical protein